MKTANKNLVNCELESVQTLSANNKEDIELKLLVKNNSLFLLHGYRLSNDQVITQSTQADKSLLTATVKDTNKLRAFLRGLGDNIEVIAPQKLRQYFAELSERLYFAYQEKAVQNNQMFTD